MGFESPHYINWATKQRLQTRLTPSEQGGPVVDNTTHAFYKIVPPEKYFDKHPEYFGMGEDGKRKRVAHQLCTTNPEVIEIVAIKVREHFRNNPDADFISLAQEDNVNWCRCENCRKYDTKEVLEKVIEKDVFSKINVISDGLWAFLNAVAEKVYPEFPDKKIYTLAYNSTIFPPRNIKPHPMIMPFICHMAPANYACPINKTNDQQNSRFADIIKQWRQTGIELGYFAYTTKGMWEQNPWPIFRRQVADIRCLHRNKFMGYESQTLEGHWGQMGINYYIMAKALWNPDLDIEATLKDYFDHAFGPSARAMEHYYNAIEKAFTAPGNFIHHLAFRETKQFITPEVIEECDKALEEAYANCTDDIIRNRIEIVDIPYRYAKMYRKSFDLFEEGYVAEAYKLLGEACKFAEKNDGRDSLMFENIWSYLMVYYINARYCLNPQKAEKSDAHKEDLLV